MKVKKQDKLDMVEEKNFRRGELLGKYMARMLYGQDNGKFKNKYLKKLERNCQKQKGKGSDASFFGNRNFKERIISDA